MRLVLRWTRLHLLCSTSPPAPAPFDEYFIEQKRQPSSCSPLLFSDSVRALGTYRLQMMTVSARLGREWRAYRIRRKRCVYSRKLYTVSFSPGTQGRPGFHSECSCQEQQQLPNSCVQQRSSLFINRLLITRRAGETSVT